MLRYKQNLYPVMFLTQGTTKKYTKYRDPRCSTVEFAVKHACCMELLGIVAHTEDLLRDSSQVRYLFKCLLCFPNLLSSKNFKFFSQFLLKINLAKEEGLVIFCWGEDNNCQDTIKQLKSLGIHGVIYDKMDVLSTKGSNVSLFLYTQDSHQKLITYGFIEFRYWFKTKFLFSVYFMFVPPPFLCIYFPLIFNFINW